MNGTRANNYVFTPVIIVFTSIYACMHPYGMIELKTRKRSETSWYINTKKSGQNTNKAISNYILREWPICDIIFFIFLDIQVVDRFDLVW